MEILFSRYNLPFSEKPMPGVHYIAKDHQFLMHQGFYDSHVDFYYQSKPWLKSSTTPLNTLITTPKVVVDNELLDSLALDFGVKACQQMRSNQRNFKA